MSHFTDYTTRLDALNHTLAVLSANGLAGATEEVIDEQTGAKSWDFNSSAAARALKKAITAEAKRIATELSKELT